MKKIIIVGTGKACKIHYRSYDLLNLKNQLFFVDNNLDIKKFNGFPVFHSISEALTLNNITPSDVIVDIVTPKDCFVEIIKQCKNLNIFDIIVEKPFVTTESFLKKTDCNIVMIQNYLYSKIYQELKNYIINNDLTIKHVFSNFSKNRIEESLRGRGMKDKKIVPCFEIEMPHQMYLVDDLICGNCELQYMISGDMITPEGTLKNLGNCEIELRNKNKSALIFSDLQTNHMEKSITVYCDKLTIKANFMTYTKDLTKLSKGSLVAYANNKVIFSKEYDEDDMFTYMLDSYIKYFNAGNFDKEYKEKIINFSNLYNKLERTL